MLQPGCLVAYKTRPALVRSMSGKLELVLEDGKTQKVRPKDVVALHSGPVRSLGEIKPQDGEVEAAWELLEGGCTNLAELAELAFGECTPSAAWAAWELIGEGLYFTGTADEVVARTREEVEQTQRSREARAEHQQAWAALMDRVRARRTLPEDERFIEPLKHLALGQANENPILEELGRPETPENAHALLLSLAVWDHSVVPYPPRLGLATSPPDVELPDLPTEDRVDLTHLPAFAIDDEGCQDPDDAVSYDCGRVWVHVADVATLVRPDSAVDVEARGRGANLYLPDGTVPMLPGRATEVLGLGLAEKSPALSFGVDVAADSWITGVEIVPSWVRVERVTYEQVDARLGEDPFRVLHELALAREITRRENGATTIEMPEVKIRVVDGKVNITPLLPLKSRSLVTETMVLCGEAIAQFAIQNGIPLPFATHDPPDEAVEGEGLAGMFALRRSMKPSRQRGTPGPHAGLGIEAYVQTTSPLRRYLDLVVHQQLRAHLAGEGPLDEQALLERVGAADAVAASVRRAERFSRKHWTLVYLTQHSDWQGEGVIVEKWGPRSKLLIPDLDLETRLHLRQDLPLNSILRLKVDRIMLHELDASFRVVE